MVFTGDVVKSDIYGDVAVLTCKADKTWGGKLPVCKKKKCSLQDGGIIRVCTEIYLYKIKLSSFINGF